MIDMASIQIKSLQLNFGNLNSTPAELVPHIGSATSGV